MPYGTVALLKSRLAVTSSAEDTLLGELLDAASTKVDGLAGHGFSLGSATRSYGSEVLLSEDRRMLYLDAPLSAVTTLTNGDGVVVAGANYVLLPRNAAAKDAILLTMASGLLFSFGAGDGAITVLGTWVVPQNVIEATYVIAEALYRRGEDGSIVLDRALEDARLLLAMPLSFGVL